MHCTFKIRIFSNTNQGPLQPLKQNNIRTTTIAKTMIYVSHICHTPHTCGLETTPWTHSMDYHYVKLQFLNTFPQDIASIVHKFTPSITSDLASEIILCDSESKYNSSESGAIHLSLLQNNDELINLKKARKFNLLNNFNRKQMNHY